MPWHITEQHSGCPSSKPWAVIKDADGSVTGCFATKADALKQLAALYASEKGGRTVTVAERAKYQVVEKAPGCPESKPWGVVGEDGKRLEGCSCHETEEGAKGHMAAYFAGKASARHVVEVRAAERHLVAIWLGEEQPGMLL